MLTTQRLVERTLAAFGDRIAAIDAEGSITYAALRERTGRLANVLRGLRAGPEFPAAVLLPNDRRFVEVDLACMRAGVTRVGIGTRLSTDECHYILEHSRSRVLVTSRALCERVDASRLPDLGKVLLVDDDAPAGTEPSRVAGYEAALASASPQIDVSPVAPGHPAYILYTSGTTGRPKGATHTHGGRVAALVNMLAAEIRADGRSVMVHCAPLTHGSGSKLLTFLALGATNVILPRFEPLEFARALRTHGGTHSFMVPTMLQMLLEGGEEVRAAIRGMSQLSFGGAPITDALFGRAVEGFGPILTQVYGSCEAPHPVTVLQPDDYMRLPDPSAMAQTAGRASHASELSIVDDQGQAAKPGEEGELLVRGSYLMDRYWRDEGATAEAFTPERWYATGDVAVIDEAGWVRFRDRKRDLVISGGLNVYPSEVERVLAAHPDVKEVAVVGCPDDRWGEAVLACVVARDGATVTERDLVDWSGRYLAGYKKPKKVLFMTELPKGSTNKVLKRELKARFWQGRERRIN